MKKIIVSDVAYDVLKKIQFAVSIKGRELSLSASLVDYCKEVCRYVPKDCILNIDSLCKEFFNELY